jgi:AcrR family transcriptional regulator
MVETRRRQIEDVASELFRANGYAATSVRDIARALDVQGATLYSHVTSKEDVLWAIVQRAASAFEHAAGQAAATTVRATPAERLRALVVAHVGVVTSDPEAASVFDREWRHLTDLRRQEILVRRDAYEARFRGVIADGRASGAFHAPDPALAASYLLTACNAVAVWYRPTGRRSATEIAEAYADLSVRALAEASR